MQAAVALVLDHLAYYRAELDTLMTEKFAIIDPEALAAHWQGAGDNDKAAAYAAQAAERASKALAFNKMRYLGTLRYMLPWMTADLDEIEEVFGGDPWPYGVEPNRVALEALVQYLVDQSIIAKPIRIDDLFVPAYGGT